MEKLQGGCISCLETCVQLWGGFQTSEKSARLPDVNCSVSELCGHATPPDVHLTSRYVTARFSLGSRPQPGNEASDDFSAPTSAMVELQGRCSNS